jgi:cell division protein FtsL
MSSYVAQRQSSRNVAAFVLFLIGIVLTVGLYYVKTKAQSAKADVARLEQLVLTEKAAINVLEAELAHLESPARLSALAKAQLGLEPIGTDHLGSVENLDEEFPLRAGVPDGEAP